jgi:hypothetical protein
MADLGSPWLCMPHRDQDRRERDDDHADDKLPIIHPISLSDA